MNVSLSLAMEGVRSAIDQQATVARRVTSMAGDAQNADLATQSVKQVENQQAVSANAKVAQTVNPMLGTLVDIVS